MVPPVPIPNTVVKHSYAESTCLETDWEDRALPVEVEAPVRVLFSYVYDILSVLWSIFFRREIELWSKNLRSLLCVAMFWTWP